MPAVIDTEEKDKSPAGRDNIHSRNCWEASSFKRQEEKTEWIFMYVAAAATTCFQKQWSKTVSVFNTQLQRHMSVKRTMSCHWIHSLLIFWPQKLQGDWVRRFCEILKNTFCENKKLEFVPLCSCSFISYMRWKSIHAYTDTHRWHLKRILQPCALPGWVFPSCDSTLFFLSLSFSLLFFISLPEKHLLGFFPHQNWKGIKKKKKHQFFPQNLDVSIEWWSKHSYYSVWNSAVQSAKWWTMKM